MFKKGDKVIEKSIYSRYGNQKLIVKEVCFSPRISSGKTEQFIVFDYKAHEYSKWSSEFVLASGKDTYIVYEPINKPKGF